MDGIIATTMVEQWKPKDVRKLVALAKRKGWSKKTLAGYIGISTVTLWQWQKDDAEIGTLNGNALSHIQRWLETIPDLPSKKK